MGRIVRAYDYGGSTYRSSEVAIPSSVVGGL
jgi:hypothetical protein